LKSLASTTDEATITSTRATERVYQADISQFPRVTEVVAVGKMISLEEGKGSEPNGVVCDDQKKAIYSRESLVPSGEQRGRVVGSLRRSFAFRCGGTEDGLAVGNFAGTYTILQLVRVCDWENERKFNTSNETRRTIRRQQTRTAEQTERFSNLETLEVNRRGCMMNSNLVKEKRLGDTCRYRLGIDVVCRYCGVRRAEQNTRRFWCGG
jgi:hypothetical protein